MDYVYTQQALERCALELPLVFHFRSELLIDGLFYLSQLEEGFGINGFFYFRLKSKIFLRISVLIAQSILNNLCKTHSKLIDLK